MEQHTTLEKLLTMIEEAVSAEKKNSERIVSSFWECSQLGIEVLPLDINRSEITCSFEDDSSLRLGFSAILSGHEPFLESLLAVRREKGGFQSFQDCCEKLELESIPASFFPGCIEAGAFDPVEDSRTRLFAGYEKILKAVRASKAEQASNQISLFAILPGASEAKIMVPPLPKVDEWTDDELIEHEHHAMGFSFTAYLLQQAEPEETESEQEAIQHVAESDREYQEQEGNSSTSERSGEVKSEDEPVPEKSDLPETESAAPFEASHVSEADVPEIQKSSMPGLEDESTAIPPFDDDAPPLPPEAFYAEEIDASFPQKFESAYSDQEDTLGDIGNEVNQAAITINSAEPATQPHYVILQCLLQTTTEQMLLRIRELCTQHPGELELFLEFIGEDQQKTCLKAHADYRVTASEGFIRSIEEVLGEHSIRLLPAPKITCYGVTVNSLTASTSSSLSVVMRTFHLPTASSALNVFWLQVRIEAYLSFSLTVATIFPLR